MESPMKITISPIELYCTERKVTQLQIFLNSKEFTDRNDLLFNYSSVGVELFCYRRPLPGEYEVIGFFHSNQLKGRSGLVAVQDAAMAVTDSFWGKLGKAPDVGAVKLLFQRWRRNTNYKPTCKIGVINFIVLDKNPGLIFTDNKE